MASKPKISAIHGSDALPVLDVSNFSFQFSGNSPKILDDIQFSLQTGQFLGIFGPNGAAKTTLLRCLAGLIPGKGQIHWNQHDVKQFKRIELARIMSYVPQAAELPFELSVRDVIEMGGYADSRILSREFDSYLDRLAISHLLSRVYNELSGGEKQRVLVARALFQSRNIVLLDEPVSAQDLEHQLNIFELLRELADSGTTVLCVSHNLPLSAAFVDLALVLQCGRMHAFGEPKTVFTSKLLRDVFRLNAELNWPADSLPQLQIRRRLKQAGQGE